jgi:hypothetical protein
MLSKNDQKKLEMLYESIANTQELLKTEEQYIETTAPNIVAQMYKNIESMRNFRGTQYLGDIIYTTFLDIINYDNIFRANKKQKEAIRFVFEFSIISRLYHTIVLVSKDFVMFRDLEYAFHYSNNDQTTNIPYKNKEEVIEKVKTTLKDLILFYYQLFSDPKTHELSHKWYLWRREQLNYKELTTRVPELDGLF